MNINEMDFIDVCSKINAFHFSSRQTTNQELGLPKDTRLEHDDRLQRVAKWIWNQRTGNDSSPIQVLNYILYGGNVEDITERIWEAAFQESWHLQRFGLGCIGEIVGWAMPDKFPPRNGRTSKAIYALGYKVKIYSE